LQRGLKAVRHLVDYGAYRRRVAAAGSAKAAARRRVAKSGAAKGAATLTEAESKAILGEAGLPVTREILARTPKDARKAAAEIGGVVAVKVQSPDIPHKSDVGGVVLGVKTPEAAEKAAELVLERSRAACPDADIHGVLVQEMVTDGTELILGMTYDEQFGPLVVLGAGGVMVEIFKDAAVRLPPFDAEEVRGMIAELKASKMLEGFRGAAPRDIDALVETCVAFGKFVAETDGQYAAIDLNPVFVLAKGRGVRIADALIVPKDNAQGASHGS
jgi:acyl-CoA synthetase (NDP forming)